MPASLDQDTQAVNISNLVKQLVEQNPDGAMFKYDCGTMITIVRGTVALWGRDGELQGYAFNDPNSYVCMTCDPCDLEQLFEGALQNV
jgi:hypothetical protein